MMFKVGDRVMVHRNGAQIMEKAGRIVKEYGVSYVKDAYLIELDEEVGHDGDYDGSTAADRGWYAERHEISILDEVTTTTTTNNPLFYYKASEDVATDAWKTLAEGLSNMDAPAAHAAIQDWEEEYKKETNEPLPGSWRSAKSVIKSAYEYGIPFLENGKARGKTAVEKEVQRAKVVGAAVATPATAFQIAIKKANDLAKFCDANALSCKIEIDGVAFVKP